MQDRTATPLSPKLAGVSSLLAAAVDAVRLDEERFLLRPTNLQKPMSIQQMYENADERQAFLGRAVRTRA